MINENDLEEIINAVIWSYEECGFEVPQNILDTCNKLKQIQSVLNEYNVTVENIREVLLAGQMFINPSTFDECIKEWNKKGFKYIRCSNALEFENKKEDITICILKGDENINITDNSYCYSRAISFELHNLIHKTIKAWEVENDK